MAEKKLMVVIGAKASEFNRTMAKVQKETKQISKAFKDVGRDMQTVGKSMTAAITVPIVAAGGASVKAFGDFQKTMAQSTAIMGDLSQDMRQKMELAAREVAKTTRFSATDAAQAFEFLALAGLDAEQSLAALPQVAAFAQAGNFDLARATDLATDAQAALGMAAKDAQVNLRNLTRVTDVLTRAATLANANTEQFSEALTEKAGVAMRNLEIDIEQGTAALAVFANQGVKGSAAGTTLNATLEGLSRQAIKNKDLFKAYGVEVFDSTGKMRHLADITADLEMALGAMSTEEQRATLLKLGFNRQALNGIQLLIGNSDALREFERELRHAGGTTDAVAEKQLANFYDRMGLIKSRLVDTGIELGSKLVPIIEDVFVPAIEKGAEFVGRLAEWFGNLSPEAQKFIVIAAAIAAAVGPVLIFLGKIAVSIGTLIPIFAKVGAIAKVIGGAIAGAFGAASAPILLVAGLIVAAIALIAKNWDDIVELFKIGWEWVSGVFQAGWEAFAGFWSDLWDGVKTVATNVWDDIVGFFERAKDRVVGIFEDIKEGVLKIWNKIVDGIKGFINRIIDGINIFIGGMNKIKFKAPDWVPGIGGQEFGFNIGLIPRLAKGGVTLSAGTVMVGEQGPELLHLPKGATVQPLNYSQEVRHTGKIRVEGVNSHGELTGVVDIIIERLLAEVRA